ncbi:Actin-related protein 6 [Oleoguttula sp. CCFEE 5521]
MARQKPQAPPSASLQPRTLILDNGADSIKAGFSSHLDNIAPSQCHIIPNSISHSTRDRRTYIASQLHSCLDFGELAFRHPVENGYIVNWESQKAIWEYEFFEDGAKSRGLWCEARETSLILTEQSSAPIAVQRQADEMVMEEFGFGAYGRVVGASLSAFSSSPFDGPAVQAGVPMECLLVIDAGYSHTTVTPVLHGRVLQSACRRLDIGGKTLTNQLKDLVSTRQFELQKEDWMANQIKEDVCFVSQDFDADLERVWKGGMKDRCKIDHSIVVDYVLPDYEEIKRGFARPHDPSSSARKRQLGIGMPREDLVVIANERFTVPELLFTPSDIGMRSEGLVGTILQSLNALPVGLWQAFLANMLVIGGSSKLPGFVERLESDLRSRLSDDSVLRVAHADDPITHTWTGGQRLAQNETALKEVIVSREEYLEQGDSWMRRRFLGKTGG